MILADRSPADLFAELLASPTRQRCDVDQNSSCRAVLSIGLPSRMCGDDQRLTHPTPILMRSVA